MKRIRVATIKDMEAIYMMGYDVWGEGMPIEKYVRSCHTSAKYKRGMWYVLEDTETEELVSSLIVHPLDNSIARGLLLMACF
ncbi:hypothetical protein [Brevibacillus daliensis]|uniref:hypothetical protein n=1 Tax=Brevibacillus daliensis TaxID=2892995 RepID=UPI001E2A25EC|nr:hypothetical protein [Brevibacillus daliensis]